MENQAGVYKLKLYENKNFSYLFDSNGDINLSSISNSGEVLEFDTNENSPKYSNNLVPAGNNQVISDYLLSLEINGLYQSNLDKLEILTSSIYGWIPLIEFMNNEKYLINVPFFEKVNPFDAQVSHTFFVELKPRVFSTKKIQSVIETQYGESFVITIDTDLGFDSSFALPLRSGYNYNFIVDWGDGSQNTITTYNDPNIDHVYATSGEYTISITGLCESWWWGSKSDDSVVLVSVDNFGDVGFITAEDMFQGCTNLSQLSSDNLEVFNLVEDFSGAWNGCSSLTSFPLFDLSAGTIFFAAWADCSGLTSFQASIFGTGILDLSLTWRDCTNLTEIENVGSIDITNLDTATYNSAFGMLDGVTLDTSNYDSLLIGWEAQTEPSGIDLDGGNSNYSAAAATARAALVSNGWSITDGGPE